MRFSKIELSDDGGETISSRHSPLGLPGRATGGQSYAQDHAAVVAKAIIQIVVKSLLGWLYGGPTDALRVAREEIEALLREEFHEMRAKYATKFALSTDAAKTCRRFLPATQWI